MHHFDELTKLSTKQAGLFSRSQALALEFSPSALDRAVGSKLLVRHCERVYRIAGVPMGRPLDLWAALLWAGADGVLSHETAGWLWRLEGLGNKPPKTIDVTVPAKRRLVPPDNIALHRTRTLVHGRDWGLLAGYRCTSLARTLIDLAGVLAETNLEHAFGSAWRRNTDNRNAVLEALERLGMKGRAGASLLAKIAGRNELGPTQSWLEQRVRIAMRRANIPLPMPQLAIQDDDGKQIGVFDFAWPQHRLVVFADSWKWHGPRLAFEKDRRQSAALVAAGWFPLPVTHRRLDDDEAGFIRELKRSLRMPVEPLHREPTRKLHTPQPSDESPLAQYRRR